MPAVYQATCFRISRIPIYSPLISIWFLEFDEDGSLQFKTEALEADARFDEIGSALKIKELQRDKRELLESLEMYYKVFFLGDIPDEELKKKADTVED